MLLQDITIKPVLNGKCYAVAGANVYFSRCAATFLHKGEQVTPVCAGNWDVVLPYCERVLCVGV